MTPERRVWTFFYGSFMNPNVLAQAEVHPTAPQRGRLDGWDIEIRPRATLVPSNERCVYGILAQVSHPELDRLYAKDWFGFGTYLPEAVIVSDGEGKHVSAICYIAWSMEGGKPTDEYLQKILSTAVVHEFPDWYIERIKSFGK